MTNRNVERAAELAALQKKQAEEQRELDVKYAALAALPENVPTPAFVYAGHNLYGSRVSMRWGESYLGYNSKPNPTFSEALALLRSIGEPLPLFTVKDGCLAIKPEDTITPREREHSEVQGPYYGARIRREHERAEIEAYVQLTPDSRIQVSIYLNDVHKFGSYRAVSHTGRAVNMEHESTYKMEARPAMLGQGRTVSFASGSNRGPHSGSQMVYLFDCVEQFEAVESAIKGKQL